MEVKGWADPVGRQSSSGANKVVADALRAAPVDEKETNGAHKWAIVEERDIPDDATDAKNIRDKASNRASLIKRGRLGPFKPAGTFDAVSRSEPASKEDPRLVARVFARYMGEDNEKLSIEAAEAAKAAEASKPVEVAAQPGS